MSDRILTDNEFEGLRLYESDSDMHAVVAEKIKHVFNKLFRNTSVKSDDFYFSVFDSPDPNAFFISKNNTNNEKNVIAVSRGLIDVCSCEAEFAAIISHECGHHLWDILLGGRNTIFQEHSADLNSVDLMIQGGYNPRHIINVHNKLAGLYGRRYADISLDVHGNLLERVEEIKDYMTKIANERGDFAQLYDEKDVEWQYFQNKVSDTYKKNEYDTYIEKCLKNKLKSKKLDDLSGWDVIDVLMEQINSQNISLLIPVRYKEMEYILDTYKKQGLFDNKTETQIQKCQNLFRELYNQYRNSPVSLQKDYVSSLQRILYSCKLDKFDDFLIQENNIKNFISYKDKQDAIRWAKEIYKLRWTVQYANCFKDWPELNGRGVDNIGKPLPWTEISQFIEQTEDEQDRTALSVALNLLHNMDKNNFTPRYSVNSWKESYYEHNGIVIAFGDEAEKLIQNDTENANKQKELKEYESTYTQFKDTVVFLDLLSDFYKDSNPETLDKLIYLVKSEYELTRFVPYDSMLLILPRTLNILPNYNNPYLSDIKKLYKTSRGIQWLLSNNDSKIRNFRKKHRDIEKRNYVKQSKIIDDVLLQEKYDLLEVFDNTAIGYNSFLKKKIVLALLKFASQVYDKNPSLSQILFEKSKSIIDVKFFDSAFPGSDHEISVDDYTTQQALLRRDYDLNNKDLDTIYVNTRVKHKKEIIKISNIGQYGRSPFDGYVIPEIDNPNYKESQILKTTMITMGFAPNKTFEENLLTLDSLLGHDVSIGWGDYKKRNILQDNIYDTPSVLFHDISNINSCPDGMDIVKFITNAGILMWANAIKKGENYNIVTILHYLRYSRSSSGYSPIITNLIAVDIEKHNRFMNLSLKDKIFVYEVLEQKDLFSEKYETKIKYFNQIVSEIINSNDKSAVDYAEAFLSRNYAVLERGNEKKGKDIEFIKEKNLLIDFYVKNKSAVLGMDDGSDEFYNKATILAQEISVKDKFSCDIKQQILNKLSTNIVSQKRTAEMLDNIGSIKVSANDAERWDYGARIAGGILSALAKDAKSAKATINFLSTKYSPESADVVLNFVDTSTGYNFRSGMQIPGFNIVLDRASLRMLHENFWNTDLPIRALIMKRILLAYTQDCRVDYDEETKIKNKLKKKIKDETKLKEQLKSEKDKLILQKIKTKKLDLLLDMFFDKESSFYDDAKKVIYAVYDNLQDYEQDLIMGALLGASQKDVNDKNMNSGENVGNGLKLFFENKGPAFVKFGQLLSYLPMLDSDIRKPLATLRDHADLPTRADLFKLINETLPESEVRKITYVDKILGAGSFFITVKVKYDGKDSVVAVMRPNAKDLVESGMDMINRTISDLSAQDDKYKALKNIAQQAQVSAMSEVDIQADYAKFIDAVSMYDGVKVLTPAGVFTPSVAKWQAYGKGKESQVYKVMEMAPGISMTSENMNEQTKHDMAVAYVALELANLLSGAKWDTDRHQGQQNFLIDNDKNVKIGIFDTGAKILKNPNMKDRIFLGILLYGMARAARNGDNITDYMVNKIKKIDKWGDKFKFDVSYIDSVQRGLTALSDIMNYQKEIKDEHGNILVESKSLSGDDLASIVTAVLNSGIVDKTVEKTIVFQAVLNKLLPIRKGWVQSLSEGVKTTESDIVIQREPFNEYEPFNAVNKPQDEIEANDAINSNEYGVNTKHIQEKSPDRI